jgi:hypothetical protein
MTLGMIVRCDQGGLGNQTYALWKHLRPDVTLLIDLPTHKGRGRGEPAKYHAEWTTVWPWNDDVIPVRMIADLARKVDTILTVETMYSGPQGFVEAHQAGARTILVANPELYPGYPASVIVTPTPWCVRSMPAGTRILPHPVEDPPNKMHRRRHSCTTFFHPVAPAMLDRNGTEIVMSALGHVKNACDLVIHAPGKKSPWEGDTCKIGNVSVRWVCKPKRSYWDAYDVETDVMLLPRRYGGLCLPVQEAAACGLPTVMTDVEPQQWWPTWRVPCHVQTERNMRGGTFPVYDVRPEYLASMMDDLVAGEVDVEGMSISAKQWSRAISWDALEDEWRDLCA